MCTFVSAWGYVHMSTGACWGQQLWVPPGTGATGGWEPWVLSLQPQGAFVLLALGRSLVSHSHPAMHSQHFHTRFWGTHSRSAINWWSSLSSLEVWITELCLNYREKVWIIKRRCTYVYGLFKLTSIVGGMSETLHAHQSTGPREPSLTQIRHRFGEPPFPALEFYVPRLPLSISTWTNLLIFLSISAAYIHFLSRVAFWKWSLENTKTHIDLEKRCVLKELN